MESCALEPTARPCRLCNPLPVTKMPKKRLRAADLCEAPKRKIINLAGQRFGWLVAEAFVGMHERKSYWLCQCDCGRFVQVSASNLRRGYTRSCGCQQSVRTHGRSRTPEYWAWSRSVRHDTTFQDFASFFAYLGLRPTPSHRVRRPRSDRPFGPGNCEWSTERQPRRSKLITFRGESLTLSEWARRLDIGLPALRLRLKTHGPQIALTQRRRRRPTRPSTEKASAESPGC